MRIALIVTIIGPLLGAAGWFTQTMWLFWIGVAICTLTQWLNMQVGIMRVPVLPIIFIMSGAFQLTPWYVGMGVGLILWAVLEAAGEIIGLIRETRT